MELSRATKGCGHAYDISRDQSDRQFCLLFEMATYPTDGGCPGDFRHFISLLPYNSPLYAMFGLRTALPGARSMGTTSHLMPVLNFLST